MKEFTILFYQCFIIIIHIWNMKTLEKLFVGFIVLNITKKNVVISSGYHTIILDVWLPFGVLAFSGNIGDKINEH